MIEISEAAQGYLRTLLEKQEAEGTGIRVFVANPGTPRRKPASPIAAPGKHRTTILEWLSQGSPRGLKSEASPT